jgi:hypothetical protein
MPLPDMQDPNVQVDWAYWHNSHGMDATRFVELFTADKPGCLCLQWLPAGDP